MEKKRTIAERQKRLDRMCKIMEYVAPLIVSAIATTIICLMVLK